MLQASSGKAYVPKISVIPPRTDLPEIAKDIPKMPPEGAPEFDAAKPETDFQLQQALKVVRAMEGAQHAAN